MIHERFLAIIYGFIYAVSLGAEIVTIKSLNYNSVPLILPAYTALLSNQVWLFILPVYWYQYASRKVLKKTYWGQYIATGFLSFGIIILRHISLNSMPGSVFAILISTSILFTMILSKLVLHRTFTYWHIGAAVFCLASAFSIGFSALFTDQEDSARVNYKVGISSAITASFLIGVMNITQEFIQLSWDNYDIRVVEIMMISSLIASALIGVYGTLSKEVVEWSPALTAATQTQEGLILVTCVSVSLPIIKLLIRNTKNATIKNSNAFFVEFAQSSGSLLGSLANILVFQEPWGVGYIVAIILMAISFILYAQTKRKVDMPPPPNYPKGEIHIINPLDANLKISTATAKQQENGKIVVSVTLWK
jgi:drug/metabolite transporter (DMT)-like permease